MGSYVRLLKCFFYRRFNRPPIHFKNFINFMNFINSYKLTQKEDFVTRIYKPGSVSTGGCLSFIWGKCRHLPLSAYPPRLSEQPSSLGLFGLSSHEVYPIQQLPAIPVSSYLTFSPLPQRIVAVIFCGTCCHFVLRQNAFPLGSMVLCDARTFLYLLLDSDKPIRVTFAKLR